ncbi:MAG: WD40 repeat domain-containing serine/threonine protein kinase [Opitutaceae bacterium]|nr:WD40 repeat domain-containing serine/threonine protein kinase [Opitutaceae bacterium]
MPPASPSSCPPPPPIADYELLRLIGRGSYGDVWLARGVTGVFRAVKIVWRDRFPDVRPYEREFEGITRFAAISLREPSQLALLHAGRQDAAGFFYYVMELADDTTLGREIDPDHYTPRTLKDFAAHHGHRLEVAEVVALGTALARALASLHAAGLVHRDIKPSNVILVGGVPKLADVGLVAQASAQLTFVGTEGFVPPEGPGAPGADVYSLGKLLYELATGLDRHDWPRLPPDLATRPDQRALLELNEILVRACEPDARQRFTDAAALLDELLLLQAGKSVRRLRRAERRTARALRFAAVLAVIACLAGAGAWIERKRAEEETQLRRAAEAERDALARQTIYAGQLAQAQLALDQNDYGRARRILPEAAKTLGGPAAVGVEWHMLSRMAHGDPSEVMRVGGEPIDRLVLSPDRALLAVHDESKVVTLYDTTSRKPVRNINGVQRLAGFSADGRWIMGSRTNPTTGLQRWHVRDGEPEKNFLPGGPFRPLGCERNNRIVAFEDSQAGGSRLGRTNGPSLIVWDFPEQREICRISLADADPSIAWDFFLGISNPDGTQALIVCVASMGSKSQFRMTHADLGPEPRAEHRFVGDFLPSAAGHQGGESGGHWWVAEKGSNRQLIFDPASRNWSFAQMSFPPETILRLALPGADPIAVIAFQATLALSRSDGSSPHLRRFVGHSAGVTTVAGDAATGVFSADSSGELRWWDLHAPAGGVVTRQCWDPKSAASRVIFSEDGNRLYVPSEETTVAILDAKTLAILDAAPRLRRPISATPIGFWAVSEDALALSHWDTSTRAVTKSLARSSQPVHA